MALSILDGNQSATTLSTILTSGQHITAHTVVSLGTQAITDMRSAVSGSVVSISNLPATQPVSIASVTIGNSVTIGSLPAISGTVTANLESASESFWGSGNSFATAVQAGLLNYSENEAPFPISGVVTVSNIQTVTLGSDLINTTRYPTAIVGYDGENGTWEAIPLSSGESSARGVIVGNSSGVFREDNRLPISGTVTANVFGRDVQTGTDLRLPITPFDDTISLSGTPVVPVQITNLAGSVAESNPLPISGTVTIGSAIPAGTNRIGVVTIGGGTVTIGAGTAQIGSVTASISGTVPISISSVTVGNSVTIGSLPAISGTVTANLAISSSAITSGSFTSLTSATLVPANTARKMATVYNLGAGQLFINAGASATTLGGGFMVALSSGDFYECDYTTTTLSAIFATAGTASWVSH
jgi:hypothetical protein